MSPYPTPTPPVNNKMKMKHSGKVLCVGSAVAGQSHGSWKQEASDFVTLGFEVWPLLKWSELKVGRAHLQFKCKVLVSTYALLPYISPTLLT